MALSLASASLSFGGFSLPTAPKKAPPSFAYGACPPRQLARAFGPPARARLALLSDALLRARSTGLPGNYNIIGGEALNFDPAGFLEGKSELEVNRYREAELTHGRVGMLASAGFLVQEKFHPLFSGDGGPAIDQIPQLPIWLWVVMAGGIAGAEAFRINTGFRELDGEKLKAETALRPGYVPGDLGFDPYAPRRSSQPTAVGPHPPAAHPRCRSLLTSRRLTLCAGLASSRPTPPSSRSCRRRSSRTPASA